MNDPLPGEGRPEYWCTISQSQLLVPGLGTSIMTLWNITMHLVYAPSLVLSAVMVGNVTANGSSMQFIFSYLSMSLRHKLMPWSGNYQYGYVSTVCIIWKSPWCLSYPHQNHHSTQLYMYIGYNMYCDIIMYHIHLQLSQNTWSTPELFCFLQPISYTYKYVSANEIWDIKNIRLANLFIGNCIRAQE